MKNKYIVLNEPGKFQSKQNTIDLKLSEGEALVKIKKIGVCGTDYHAFRGNQPFFTYPRVLGHELGAEVVQLQSASNDLEIGDRVAVEPYLNCGRCQPCRNGKSNCCEQLKVLGVHVDGGMASYLKVPVNKLHRSSVLSYDHLATIEFLGIGAHAVERSNIKKGDTVLVIGAGPIGLSVVQFAKLKGIKVVVMDFNKNRLNFAQSRLKADEIICPDKDFSPENLREVLNGELPDAVFDATGNKTSMENSFNYLCSGGKLIFVGLFIGEIQFHDPLFHKNEITLMASRNALPQEFKKIIHLMEQKKIDINQWITHSCNFDEFPDTIEIWIDPEQMVIKGMISL
jgi:2-desacetyl-2-hydroxyethyl bacteriochlorophyllide A dehydrogenase